eukprot:2806936-Amphidinium_carterae.1
MRSTPIQFEPSVMGVDTISTVQLHRAVLTLLAARVTDLLHRSSCTENDRSNICTRPPRPDTISIVQLHRAVLTLLAARVKDLLHRSSCTENDRSNMYMLWLLTCAMVSKIRSVIAAGIAA